MALSPLINAQIARQDSVIEIVRKGNGEQTHDEVFITTSLTLAEDLDTDEVTLILPMSSTAGRRPIMRYTEDALPDAATFDPVDRSLLDQMVADALQRVDQAAREAQAQLAAAVQEATKGVSQAVLKVKPGQRDLRFFYSVVAPRVEGTQQFALEVLGPLASFILQPGGSIGVVALLPRGASYLTSSAEQIPGDPASALPAATPTQLGGRVCLGWTWQNDPLFKISYQY